MPNRPGRSYFDRLSHDTEFNRDMLEKVFRLMDLLKDISSAPGIQDKLALKGGTAIQFAYTDFVRLSVDIDFNYVGSIDRTVMQSERGEIREMLRRIFQEHAYIIDNAVDRYALDQFILVYENIMKNRERLKIEINYLERLPVLPLVSKRMNHPFEIIGDVNFMTYPFEELFASKTRALLTRGSPRDLYDLCLLADSSSTYDSSLYRVLTIFYLCLAAVDVRTLTTKKIQDIDDMAVRRYLFPMLKRGDRGVDHTTMKEKALSIVTPILDFNSDETRFLDEFYEHQNFVQDLLFKDVDLSIDLSTHPSVKWRFQRGKNGLSDTA